MARRVTAAVTDDYVSVQNVEEVVKKSREALLELQDLKSRSDRTQALKAAAAEASAARRRRRCKRTSVSSLALCLSKNVLAGGPTIASLLK